MPAIQPPPLTGFTIAVTANRRADELSSLLERRGARVLSAAAMRLIPLADDVALQASTQALLDRPPTIVIATTGLGFRGWIEAAEGWGVAEELLDLIEQTQIISRGPKPTGALRAAGLREKWSPASESSPEVLEYLLERGIKGERIAVQLHGATKEWDPAPGFIAGLRDGGAEVVEVPVYRWVLPEPTEEIDALITAVSNQECDAITFTSAPAVVATIQRARALGLGAAYLHALRGTTLTMSVGPVTSAPLRREGIEPEEPKRMRLGSLVRHLAEVLPAHVPELTVSGRRLQLRAQTVAVDGETIALTTGGIRVLQLLAARPGAVVTREAILAALPGDSQDTHAVETAIARLRTALGDKHLIKTVVKRGYRLDVEPGANASGAASQAPPQPQKPTQPQTQED